MESSVADTVSLVRVGHLLPLPPIFESVRERFDATEPYRHEGEGEHHEDCHDSLHRISDAPLCASCRAVLALVRPPGARR